MVHTYREHMVREDGSAQQPFYDKPLPPGTLILLENDIWSSVDYQGLPVEGQTILDDLAAWCGVKIAIPVCWTPPKSVPERSEHQQMIDQFMRLAGQTLPTQPTEPSDDVKKLRATLIAEEAKESIEALGFACDIKIDYDHVGFFDLIAVADGCADLSVVTIGTLSACGIADVELLAEVDASNLRKFAGNGYRREDGKWVKPTDWQPPDIARVLEQQRSDVLDQ